MSTKEEDGAPMSLEEATRQRLEEMTGPVEFSDLGAHIERNAIFVVAGPLIDCAVAVAMDDVEKVSAMIDRRELRRPRGSELAAWSSDAGRRWLAVIVQPYVLVQDLPS